MIQKYPQLFKPFFVYEDVALTPSVLKEQLLLNETSNALEERATEFFSRYMDENVELLCGEGNLNGGVYRVYQKRQRLKILIR